jgi:hypothetical protein
MTIVAGSLPRQFHDVKSDLLEPREAAAVVAG